MMRILSTVAALSVVTVPLAAQSSPAAETAIRDRIAALQTAWNKHDAAGVAAVYAADGDAMIIDGPLSAGTAALQAAATREIAARSPTLRISITPTNIRFLTPDVAIVNTRAQFNEPDVKEDRGTWVFVRRDGKWLVAATRVQPAQKP